MHYTGLFRARLNAQSVNHNERRHNERFDVLIHTQIWDKNNNVEPITITNISPVGLLAKGKGKYQIGATVRFDLYGFGNKDAVIRWAGNGLIGCEFLAPISERMFQNEVKHLPRP
jgi:hypothetical protein